METGLVRQRLASEKKSDSKTVLLAALHIPQDATEMRVESSFVLLAVRRSASTNTENCRQFLDTLTRTLRTDKAARPRGEVTEYKVGGHEFVRADFEYYSGPNDRATLCSPAKEYLLLWDIDGLFWDSVDDAASTTYTIIPWPPSGTTDAPQPRSVQVPVQDFIPQNVSTALLIKKVQPVYPPEARQNHIRGIVRLQAVISEVGDVVNLELLEGPIELAASTVNAVRQWKYKPYLLDGKSIPVLTDIVVNY